MTYVNVIVSSDTMDNRGAFITLNGKDMKPYFTSYEAMVCILLNLIKILVFRTVFYADYVKIIHCNILLQPHPNVRPMAYANSLLKFMC